MLTNSRFHRIHMRCVISWITNPKSITRMKSPMRVIRQHAVPTSKFVLKSPRSFLIVTVLRFAMSLADRLRKLQTPAAPPQLPDMSLEEMEELCLEFGQKHLGKKFMGRMVTLQILFLKASCEVLGTTKRVHQLTRMHFW